MKTMNEEAYLLPWRLWMLYQIEPGLIDIALKALSKKRRSVSVRLEAYGEAKEAADMLLGWGARDPRLRSCAAWDCFFNYICDELNI